MDHIGYTFVVAPRFAQQSLATRVGRGFEMDSMRQRLGQHFLKNTEALRLLVASLDTQEGEIVIEIGPGHGALTKPLLVECERQGARLIAVEKDESLAQKLATENKNKNAVLAIVVGDIRTELSGLIASFGKTPYVLAGNIPYYLTGRLFTLISGLDHKPRKVVFTVQEEVADRIVAAPPRMNRLAAAVQVWSRPRILLRLSENDFDPPPEVRSAILVLETRSDAPQGETLRRYYAMMRALFSQPRKTIVKNLLSVTDLPRPALEAIIRRTGLDPAMRPQDVSIPAVLDLSQTLERLVPPASHETAGSRTERHGTRNGV